MGYDPYDYYDLGTIDQKDSIKTWFGSKNELEELINTAHLNGMQVYADLILNHTNGADEEEISLFGRSAGQNKLPEVANFIVIGHAIIQVISIDGTRGV